MHFLSHSLVRRLVGLCVCSSFALSADTNMTSTISQLYGQLPGTPALAVSEFTVDISQDAVTEFQTLLQLSRVGPATFENVQVNRTYGITRDWLSDAKTKWLASDWRSVETQINAFPNFKAAVSDASGSFDIHFTALFSLKSDAVPLIFLHGWPGSFLEFLPVLSLFQQDYTPETLPYHLIVPSLPGYAFSSPPPLDRNFNLTDVARIMDSLMTGLGFGDNYIIHGGDVGSQVAIAMAARFPGVKAVHITNGITAKPDGVNETYTPEEIAGLERTSNFATYGVAYAGEHATKPSTIGLVLSSNPLALLAWIGEKFLDWTDVPPSLDFILESVSLYWFTETFSRSIYPYRQLFLPGNDVFDGLGQTPFGFSWFPKEPAPVPQSWIAGTVNLVFFRSHPVGGHFAGIEQPTVLKQDLVDFFNQVLSS